VFSWGVNNFGQLGNGVDYDEFYFTPKEVKFPIEKENKFNFFVFDIATNDYSAIALAYLKEKKKVYHWGLGCGPDSLKAGENLDLLTYYNTIDNDNFNGKNNDNLVEAKKSKYPFEIPLSIDINNLVKVTGKFKLFNFLIKNKNNFGLNFALGNTSFLGFPSLNKNKYNSWFNFDFIKLDFFEENNLSIIDTSIGEDFLIYLVHDLIENMNQIYFYGIDSYNFLDEKKTLYPIPERISFKEIKNPIRITAGTKSALILDGEYEKDVDLNHNPGKINSFKLFEIGDYFNRKNVKENIKEVTGIDFKGKEIVKMDCYFNNISLLIKE
jgi:hypothetical protein